MLKESQILPLGLKKKMLDKFSKEINDLYKINGIPKNRTTSQAVHNQITACHGP